MFWEVASATSTGGIGGEISGRVSDTPTVAGNYANKFAGVSATGIGEQIVNISLASKITTRVEDGMKLQESVALSMDEAKKLEYNLGIIAIDYSGNVIVDKTCEIIYYAYYDGQGKKNIF